MKKFIYPLMFLAWPGSICLDASCQEGCCKSIVERKSNVVMHLGIETLGGVGEIRAVEMLLSFSFVGGVVGFVFK